LVTEHELAEADRAFPGILALYRELERKPPTFLNLLGLYLRRQAAASAGSGAEASPAQPVQLAR
jgi:hypothetical protein